MPVGHPGKPPATCHPDRPHLARGLCNSCYQSWWKAENPEKWADRQKKKPRATCHPERAALARGLCSTCYRREWREENPEANKEAVRRHYSRRSADPAYKKLHARRVRARRYGLTLEQLDALLDAQGDQCAVCGSTGKLHIDHCHGTGAIRGLLCGGCNSSAGHAGDDPARLRAIADYLERSSPVGFAGSSAD